MVWVKLTDNFADDPRFDVAGGAEAIALHVAALCYCNRHLTDGVLSRSAIRRLLALDDPLGVADRLVSAGLWNADDGEYTIIDFLDTQPSRKDVEKHRADRQSESSKVGRLEACKEGRRTPGGLSQRLGQYLS